MYPLDTILALLFSGTNRLPVAHRLDALCAMLGALLPQMNPGEIAATRARVISCFGSGTDLRDQLMDLIDGHLALRSILAMDEWDAPLRFCSEPDYEL
jgi:hypothetical protein